MRLAPGTTALPAHQAVACGCWLVPPAACHMGHSHGGLQPTLWAAPACNPQERKAAVIRAEGESESAKLISDATKQVGAAGEGHRLALAAMNCRSTPAVACMQTWSRQWAHCWLCGLPLHVPCCHLPCRPLTGRGRLPLHLACRRARA